MMSFDTMGPDLASQFRSVRDLTEQLAAPLSAEDQTAQSMPDTSPTKWHRAHTTWFFETFILERFDPNHQPVDPAYRVLFNSYYEAVGEKFPRPERGVITRPGIAEVAAYRAEIDDRITRLIDRSEPDGEFHELVRLGLHHEQQHQELLLMDIKHVLAQNPLEPIYLGEAELDDDVIEGSAGWLDFDGGLVDIGHEHGGATFTFDNEGPKHRVHLEPFRLADRLVTSGEWRAFIDDGGYRRPELWLSDGWATVQSQFWHAPLYWRQRADTWRVHTLAGTREVRSSEPVCHVSFYEADAYARWAGRRLPTEFEWEHAANTAATSSSDFDIERLHPRARTAHTRRTVSQLAGEGWQWTASAYLPYPGFVAAAGAVGEYNGKFMSGQMVLRGGSALTPPGHTRHTYRNFFPPAARWPMTTVRLAAGGGHR